MQRYFAQVTDGKAELSPDDIFHVTHVMRMSVGDRLEVVDHGRVYGAVIAAIRPFSLTLGNSFSDDRELPASVTLIYALAKGEKTDLVVQKGTELGMSAFLGVLSDRVIVRLEKDDIDKRMSRYRRIVKEAAEQSKRSALPEILGIVPFSAIALMPFDRKAIAYEGAAGSTASFQAFIAGVRPGEKVALLIGAEGGFTPEEARLAQSWGYVPISLGKRILRTETAAIAALATLAAGLEAH